MAADQQVTGWQAHVAVLESEIRRAISYIDEQVVPEIRKEGLRALHAAAADLRQLADRMDGIGKDRTP